jgi:glycosyltransferase involved in cell wall biosynthesis
MQNLTEGSRSTVTDKVNQTVSVSIVIPTYNRSATLERSIASCQRQSYPVQEIIVVDDASTDSTPTLLSHLATYCPNLRYIRLPCNQGAQYARVEGVLASRATWIIFLDADDELTPDSICSRIYNATLSNLNPGLVYGDIYLGGRTKDALFRLKELHGHEYPWLCRELSLCPYSAMMIRKDCFETTGYPDRHFPSWQDDDMVLTIAKVFPVFHCGSSVAIMHSGSDRITSDWSRLARGCQLMVRKYRDDILAHHGYFRLFLWYLRIVRARLESVYQKNL